ncbi:MAG: peptidoglycan DD-metalloendopeptidase family protein [Armatimonadetes bacterium]|nr:peptidoglycan DD-metalloendopeptidase family protein [Armatimonadota bacterium]
MRPWLLVAFLVLPAVSGWSQQSSNKAKTQVLKAKLGQVKQNKKVVQKKLHDKKVQVWNVSAEVQKLDGQIGTVEDKIVATKGKLAKSKAEQSKLAGDLGKAIVELKQKQTIAARRVRSMYMTGGGTVLTVLVGAQNLGDFAARKSLLERIARRDHDLFDTVKSLRDEIATKKKRSDAVVNEIAQLKARQQLQEQDLRGAMSRKKVVLGQLKSERDDLQEELEAMERESSRIEAQIRAYMATNGGRVSPYKGRFILPVNGRFSSPFGYRIHPISHTRKMHTGQDIAASSGTPIKAAGPGVVISTGWRGGYGNTVIIDHGGGISTLYGHCSRIFAHAGQKVATGDRIAAVGSTGYSTGPHLHFEVRVNGSPVNPRKYL